MSVYPGQVAICNKVVLQDAPLIAAELLRVADGQQMDQMDTTRLAADLECRLSLWCYRYQLEAPSDKKVASWQAALDNCFSQTNHQTVRYTVSMPVCWKCSLYPCMLPAVFRCRVDRVDSCCCAEWRIWSWLASTLPLHGKCIIITSRHPTKGKHASVGKNV